MDEQTKQELWDATAIGVFSGILGAPLAVWANRRWPNEKWKTALLLVGFGFSVRLVGLRMVDDRIEARV